MREGDVPRPKNSTKLMKNIRNSIMHLTIFGCQIFSNSFIQCVDYYNYKMVWVERCFLLDIMFIYYENC